jgi:hypothetical protein
MNVKHLLNLIYFYLGTVMGTGIWLFLARKMGFHALGWNSSAIKLRFEQDNHGLRQWDLCSWTLGFSQKLSWERGI